VSSWIRSTAARRARDGLRGAELLGEFESVLVVAHRDDPLGAESAGREHAAEADCAVADHDHGRTRLDARIDGRVVTGSHHVGQREQ